MSVLNLKYKLRVYFLFSLALLVVGCGSSTSGGSSSPTPANNLLVWTKQVGVESGSTYGRGISTDEEGNSYITGDTDISLPGQTERGNLDYFLAKYSESGFLLWTRQAGVESAYTGGIGVSTDVQGNIYITGYTSGQISESIGESSLYDYFLAKYTESGVLLWTKQVGSGFPTGITVGYAVSTDVQGNAYITGYTNESISGQIQSGLSDYFVAKYSESGAMLWTKQVGAESSGYTSGNGISVDAQGNAYISGLTTESISDQTQSGLRDYFVAKYSESGAMLWTKQVGAASSSGSTAGNGITLGIDSNIYITGYTNESISGQTQSGIEDYFIAKYNESGALLWTRQAGTESGETRGIGINADLYGNIYVTGYTNESLSDQIESGTRDYFIAKYNQSGVLLWTRQVGAESGYTDGFGVSTDALGNAYISGSTNVGISGQTQTGEFDYFIAKYYPN